MSLLQLLKRHGLRPKKGLGQNFLHDEEIAQAIVAAALSGSPGHFLEIGPGVGSLTVPLLSAVKELTVLEQDASLLPVLRSRCQGLGNLEIIHTDALRFSFRERAEALAAPLIIVANLPYHISSPMLFHLLQQGDAIQSMVLMFQKEVAERIAAAPGSKAYGTLSVHTQLWMEVTPLLSVPPTAFYPIPKVDSAVIRLHRRSTPLAEVGNYYQFQQTVKAAFGQRRKTLLNALKVLTEQPLQWLQKSGIDPQRRGETLSVVEMVHLANCWPEEAVSGAEYVEGEISAIMPSMTD
ncbi:16S rRNA (adenine(1518)-N(6)/adenine(1519)-N(6))-dimethyltransferase RsmA [Candidatus Magnetaquicoccus inordinatus]|uniref:16S rRNA (adenine(1518)-N(6)/adenine(1519)-N(6))- dimethyltransferase RsmA n=1 Tax=Candidatus Magnetaquicoccus inordinatus TaxID=2496818 RepID=UPI00102D2026|nr:16S rRNA (adenine(1518)-N(6)/adenine(1519)-N(6))-dimethyltransferase RsmA [Candidatus Magnetaquicoccus inordinatus]